jgi:hypothetical protein
MQKRIVCTHQLIVLPFCKRESTQRKKARRRRRRLARALDKKETTTTATATTTPFFLSSRGPAACSKRDVSLLFKVERHY